MYTNLIGDVRVQSFKDSSVVLGENRLNADQFDIDLKDHCYLKVLKHSSRN